MEMGSILLRSTGEIALSMVLVATLCAVCLKIAQWTRSPFFAPLIMLVLLALLFLQGAFGGTVRSMALSFGIASALLMALWSRLGEGRVSEAIKNETSANRWPYPALVASIDEMRNPSYRELRALLARVRNEILAPDLSPTGKIMVIKRVARTALKK